MTIFNLDGWFYKYGVKLFDLLIVSIMVLVISGLSIGFLTGAALTAFFYVTDKVIIHERGYLIKNFIKSFRLNLRQSTLLWIFLMLGFGLIGVSINNQSASIDRNGLILMANYFVLIELVIVSIYGFVLLSKFQLSLKEVLRKSILYGHKHLLTTLTIMSVVVITYFLVIKVHPLFIIIGLGLDGYVISRLIMEVVMPKYIDKEKLIAFTFGD